VRLIYEILLPNSWPKSLDAAYTRTNTVFHKINCSEIMALLINHESFVDAYTHTLVLLRWGRLCACETGPLIGPLSIPQMIHEWIWSSGGMILTGENRRTGRKTCPSGTSYTTKTTWTALGTNTTLAASIIRAMMEAVNTSETSVSFYQTTWRSIPEDSHLHTRPRENLKSHLHN
jgi:hypothetical protein